MSVIVFLNGTVSQEWPPWEEEPDPDPVEDDGTFINVDAPDVGMAESEECTERYTCFSSNNHLIEKSCSCDDWCHVYGDCCENKARETVSSPELLELVGLKDHGNCRSIPGYENATFVIDKCPFDFADADITKMCEHPMSDTEDLFLEVPVSQKEFGMVYSNVYCAMCHGWDNNEVAFWEADVSCDIPSAEEVHLLPGKPPHMSNKEYLNQFTAKEVMNLLNCTIS